MARVTAKNLSPEYKGGTATVSCGKHLQRKSRDPTKSLRLASVLGGGAGPKPRELEAAYERQHSDRRNDNTQTGGMIGQRRGFWERENNLR